MTSPLRFRAFYRGRMLDVFAVNPMNQTVYLSHQQLYDEPGNDVLVPIRSEIEPDGAVLMQWTGLKAIRDVMVYQDDILVMRRSFHVCRDTFEGRTTGNYYLWPMDGLYGNRLDIVSTVTWKWTGRVSFSPVRGWHLKGVVSNGWRFEKPDDVQPTAFEVHMASKTIKPRAYGLEVVGNVHQHPELLGGQ